MIICPECYTCDGHDEGCRLGPSYSRVVSRRSFLRTLGVLGSAIAVSPSLISLRTIVPVQAQSSVLLYSPNSLNQIWRKIQGDLTSAFAFQNSEWDFIASLPETPKSLYMAPAREITIPLDLSRA